MTAMGLNTFTVRLLQQTRSASRWRQKSACLVCEDVPPLGCGGVSKSTVQRVSEREKTRENKSGRERNRERETPTER